MNLKLRCGLGMAVAIFSALAYGDSLFTQRAAISGTLVSDQKARYQPGDIITVIIKEKVDASTTANTNTKKESDVDSQAGAGDNTFLTADNPGLNILNEEELPNWKIKAKDETKTRGTTTRKSSLTLTIACQVIRVYPNGNIDIYGSKDLLMNREHTTIEMSGVVRAQDVSAANTIDSNQIANASIGIKGKGPLWNNQRRGLVTRFLDWVSPF